MFLCLCKIILIHNEVKWYHTYKIWLLKKEFLFLASMKSVEYFAVLIKVSHQMRKEQILWQAENNLKQNLQLTSNILIERTDYIYEIREGCYKVGAFRTTRKGILGNYFLLNQEVAWKKSVHGQWEREGQKWKRRFKNYNKSRKRIEKRVGV